MYRLKREDFLRKRYVTLWAVLAFQAGFINSFGFLACQRFVSHVTGFGTQVGLALGAGDLLLMFEMCGTPLFFILGAFASGIFTIARIDHGKKPYYNFVAYSMPILLGICLVIGSLGYFGEFKEAVLHDHDFALLFSLSFFCGMQNGCFATMTQGQIRTTHLTGICTDLGSDLSRMFFGKPSDEELKTLKMSNVSRLATLGGFALGAIVSALVDGWLNYQALFIPLVTSIGVCVAMSFIRRKLDLDFMRDNGFPNNLVQAGRR